MEADLTDEDSQWWEGLIEMPRVEKWRSLNDGSGESTEDTMWQKL